jgi:hypothetical protein
MMEIGKANALGAFERACASDRSDIIWLPEHIDASVAAVSPEMQFAIVLALHTGQKQGDIRRFAWSTYETPASRCGKSKHCVSAAPRRAQEMACKTQ